jgi:hypothetical protein
MLSFRHLHTWKNSLVVSTPHFMRAQLILVDAASTSGGLSYKSPSRIQKDRTFMAENAHIKEKEMAKDRAYILIEGEKLPAYGPEDAYLMAMVWFGKPGSTDGVVHFVCDSHYGLKMLYDALHKVGSGKQVEPFCLELLATDALIRLIGYDPRHPLDNKPKLAKSLRIHPSSKPGLLSLEFNLKDTIELYIGIEAANDYAKLFEIYLDDYPNAHERWVTQPYDGTVVRPHEGNGLASMLFLDAAWPGLIDSSEDLIKFVQTRGL